MKYELKITEYSLEYKKAHQEFTKRNWGKARRGDPHFLKFKHRSKKSKLIENLIIAISGDRVIGQIGLIPTDFIQKRKKKFLVTGFVI